MEAPSLETIELSRIVLDKQTQPRAEIDEHIVNEYRLDMMGGALFPPLVVFENGGGTYYLADGWHRYTALKQVKPDGSAECAVFGGGLRGAILYSCKANSDHGKRRTDGDKKRAIKKMLADPEWRDWSNRRILKECGVNHSGSWNSFIESERKNLTVPKSTVRTYRTKHGSVSTMNTESIGKAPSQPKPAESVEEFYNVWASDNAQLGLDVFGDVIADDTPAETVAPAPRYDPNNYELYTCAVTELSNHIGEDSVHAIITDPPYPKEYIQVYGQLAEQAAKILKPNGILVAMCGHNYIAQLISDMSKHLHYHWMGCYYMPTGPHASLAPYSVSVYWKPLLIFSKGKWPKSRTFRDVFVNDEADKSHHEWGQGITGFKRIIEAFTLPNETVLDPFVGGGTTAIAALDLGRYFIGSDIDEGETIKTKARLI